MDVPFKTVIIPQRTYTTNADQNMWPRITISLSKSPGPISHVSAKRMRTILGIMTYDPDDAETDNFI